MSLIVSKFRVEGFRGAYTIEADFNQSINYIIGHNGTGKTTFVRMLVATLRMSTAELLKYAFNKIELVLVSSRLGVVGERPVKLSLTREVNDQDQQVIGPFNVELDDGDEIIKTTSTGLREWRKNALYNWRVGLPTAELADWYGGSKSTDGTREIEREMTAVRRIRRFMTENIQMNWLPLERATRAPDKEDGDKTSEDSSSVSQKLTEILKRLVLYSYDLDKRKALASERFRNLAFLALFEVESKVGKSPALSKSAVERLSTDINRLIPELGLTSDLEKQFRENSHRLIDTLSQRQSGRPGEALRQAFARLNGVVQLWTDTQHDVSQLYAKRTAFLESLTDAFLLADLPPSQQAKFAKLPYLTDENEIVFVQHASSGPKIIKPADLSSGEKQFFIMLSEALLERDQEVVLIVDEPELSLHITWQSRLIKDIQKLNPNVQMILATHSPDIIQSKKQNIIQMENAVIG